MKWHARTLVALLIAPLVGGTAAAVIYGLYWASSADFFVVSAIPLLAIYGVVIVAALTWTLGFMWHGLAYRLGWRSFGPYLYCGVALGAIVAAIVRQTLTDGPPLAETLFLLAWLMATGAITASVAWLIRRPDRDTPANLPTSTP